MHDRAVVLARHDAGLRAASWLASHDVAVRWLGLQGLPEPAVEPTAHLGRAPALAALLGPVIDTRPRHALLVDGHLADVPRRRRDLLGLRGRRTVGAALRLGMARAGGHHDDTFEGWCRRHLGPDATDGILLPIAAARLGGSARGLVAAQARDLFGRGGERWYAPTHQGAEGTSRRREAVLDAGGEVLPQVGVAEVEVAAGRVVAVHSDHGRELVDEVLYTDLAPRELAGLLPDDVVGDLVPCLDDLAAAHRIVVSLAIEPGDVPGVVWVGDPEVGASRLIRPPGAPGMPRPDRLDVEMIVGDDDPCWRDDAAAVRRATEAARHVALVRGEAGGVRREPRAVPRCTPAAERAIERWLERMQALGVVPLGARALHLDLMVCDEADWLTLAGASLTRARRALHHGGPRTEPWSLLV